MTAGTSATLARVLVADDDPQVLRALASSLRRAGFAVTTADDGAAAIALADAAGFEIVIADLNMRTSGTTVVHHFKRRYGAGVYCAVLSGDDDDATRRACLEAGADDVFVKPAPAAMLRRRLTEAAQALRAAAVAHERCA